MTQETETKGTRRRDRQEAFNKAYLGLKSQDFVRATAPSNYDEHFPVCVFVDVTGRHCALGWLDTTLRVRDTLGAPQLESLRLQLGGEFLVELRTCHDQGKEPEIMKTRLLDFATRYGLTVPEKHDPRFPVL